MHPAARNCLPYQLCCTLLVLMIASAAAARDSDSWSAADLAAAATLRERALSGTRALDHVTSLTTEVGPRLAGSSGDRAAVVWALNRLRDLGFEDAQAQPVTVPHWERGQTEIEITAPFAQPLVGAALGGSVGTSEEGIEAPVVTVASLDQLEALGTDRVAGNIVFVDERMEATRDGSGYAKAVRKRIRGPSAAARLGAVALVIRSVGTSNDRIAHTGGLVYDDDTARIPAIAISNPDADLLGRQMETGLPVTLHLRMTARELPAARSANVFADVRGRDPDTGIVLLGAHLDSWDLGQGAEDDGAGVAIVIEAARMIANMQSRPARTIRVVLYANEEYGLSGAGEFARQLAGDVDRIMLAMEADLGSGAPWGFDAEVAPEAVSDVMTIHRLLAPLGIEFLGNEASGGADLQVLKRAGVPVFEIHHDARPYFEVHHTVNDTLDRVDGKSLDSLVAAYAAAAYLAASKQGDFGRLPRREAGSEKQEAGKSEQADKRSSG